MAETTASTAEADIGTDAQAGLETAALIKAALDLRALKGRMAESRAPFEQKIEKARQYRRDIIRACQGDGNGLLKLDVMNTDDDKMIWDTVDKDDRQYLIETVVRVKAKTKEDVLRAYEVAKQFGLKVMPIGAKTSALRLFQKQPDALQRRGKGILGIEMPLYLAGDPECLEDGEKVDVEKWQHCPLEVPDPIPRQFSKVVYCKNYPMAILVPLEFPKTKPQIILHGTVSVKAVNDFSKVALKDVSPRHYFRLLTDITSKDIATKGGVIMTGAEGPSRASMVDELVGMKHVNSKGAIDLDQGQSRRLVGTNGNTGVCVQATIELSPFPKQKAGILIEARGKTKEEIEKNALLLQARAAKYGKRPTGNEPPGTTIMTGSEVLSKELLQQTADHHHEAHHMNKKGDFDGLMEKRDEVREEDRKFVYVTLERFEEEMELSTGDLLEIKEFLIDQKLLDQTDEPFTLSTFQNFCDTAGLENGVAMAKLIFSPIGHDLRLDLKHLIGEYQENRQDPRWVRAMPVVDSDTLTALEHIRHEGAAFSREQGNQLGGISLSSDFNVTFEDRDKMEKGLEIVAQTCAEYERKFPGTQFRVDVYGHGNVGMEGTEGGGIDLHIRVTLRLNSPQTRYSATELAQMMKDLQYKLHRDIFCQDGKHGIKIRDPEKSLFSNTAYWQWLRLYRPEEIKARTETLLEFGDEYTDFRTPFEIPREPQGMKYYFDKKLVREDREGVLAQYHHAILNFSQLSHRGYEVKGMRGELIATIRKLFGTDHYDQFIRLVPHPEEAIDLLERNYEGDEHGCEVIRITLDSLEDLSQLNDQKKIYVVDTRGIGALPGASFMVMPVAAVRKADETHRRWKREGRPVPSHGNIVSDFDSAPFEDRHTPPSPAYVSLGLLLQERYPVLGDAPRYLDRIPTFNPGPSQLHPFVALAEYVNELSTDEQKKITRQVCEFLGFPKPEGVAYCFSATEMMDLVARALGKKNETVQVLQVDNDAFCAKFGGNLAAHDAGPDEVVRTPHTTSEVSEADRVFPALAKAMDPNKKPTVLVVTPHKTSTAAAFDIKWFDEKMRAHNKISGTDYVIIADVTSSIGAMPLYLDEFPHVSVIGGVQKALGCPPGLGLGYFCPQLRQLLDLDGEGEHPYVSLEGALQRARNGQAENWFGLYLLGIKCQAEIIAGRTPEYIQAQTHSRALRVTDFFLSLVEKFLVTSPEGDQREEFSSLVFSQAQDLEDRSKILLAYIAKVRSMLMQKRILDEICGIKEGEAYGGAAEEGIRLYLASLVQASDLEPSDTPRKFEGESIDEIPQDLIDLLVCTGLSFELDEVKKARNRAAPVVTLREAMQPANVMRQHLEQLTLEAVITPTWGERLKATRYSNSEIYAVGENLELSKEILAQHDSDGKTFESWVKECGEARLALVAELGILQEGSNGLIHQPDQARVQELSRQFKRAYNVQRELFLKFVADQPESKKIDGRPLVPLVM